MATPSPQPRASIRIFLRCLALGTCGALAVVLTIWGWEWLPLAPQHGTREKAATSLDPHPANDWPHLRGPRYDGICTETSLAAAWPPEGPPLLWAAELGQGYSGFIVADGKVYTQCEHLSGQYLVCLDMTSGAELWRHRYDSARQRARAYPGTYATPTLAQGQLFFASTSGLVGCVDAATGRPGWSRNLVREFNGKGVAFGYACTPLVEDGLVLFPVGGEGASMVALHAHDGSIAWQSGDDAASYCPALPITWQGRRLVVGFLRNVLVILDLKTGRQLGRCDLSSHYDEHSAWPLYQEPHLLIASPFRLGAQLLRLEAKGDALELRPVWIKKDLSNDVLSSVLHEGHVYGFDLQELQASAQRTSRGEFRCLDFASGQVKWSTREVGHASAIVADGKLVLLNDTGTLLLVRATPDGYEELARHAVLHDGICWTPPTLWRGRLLVRNQERALCLYLGKPADLTPEARASAGTIPMSRGWRSWDWSWLIGQEPDFPNDAPSWGDLTLWYGLGLGMLALAASLTLFLHVTAALLGRRLGGFPAAVFFGATAWGLGLAGTPVLGHALQQFVWTWPVSLFVGFQTVIHTITWVESQPEKARGRWLSRGVVLLFLGMCYLYYVMCQNLGLATAWSFLIGFLPASPLAVLAARSHHRGSGWLLQALALVLAFSLFFWSGAGFIAWKASMAEEVPTF